LRNGVARSGEADQEVPEMGKDPMGGWPIERPDALRWIRKGPDQVNVSWEREIRKPRKSFFHEHKYRMGKCC
jgi:hypothetical protein